MASNSFGNLFRIMTWGESHGKAIGVVIDGCPAGLKLDDGDINGALAMRAPGKNPFTSPRKESDVAEILSGTFEGVTTGAPISIIIPNKDADSSKYEPVKRLLRPGHANYTYLEKYGIFDWRGGGRASARETACRVAGGAVAAKLLRYYGIDVVAYIKQIGDITAGSIGGSVEVIRAHTYDSDIFCPDGEAARAMKALIDVKKSEGDSIGGVVQVVVSGAPAGLGDPVYGKLEATLASALMSMPASKGFEMGRGFAAAAMSGSEHNDLFSKKEGKTVAGDNNAGGTLGGITSGMAVVGNVAFKPASSIMKGQKTVTTEGEEAVLKLPEGSRHDPCVAIRAVPVVEAMAAIVVADALLMNRCARL